MFLRNLSFLLTFSKISISLTLLIIFYIYLTNWYNFFGTLYMLNNFFSLLLLFFFNLSSLNFENEKQSTIFFEFYHYFFFHAFFIINLIFLDAFLQNFWNGGTSFTFEIKTGMCFFSEINFLFAYNLIENLKTKKKDNETILNFKNPAFSKFAKIPFRMPFVLFILAFIYFDTLSKSTLVYKTETDLILLFLFLFVKIISSIKQMHILKVFNYAKEEFLDAQIYLPRFFIQDILFKTFTTTFLFMFLIYFLLSEKFPTEQKFECNFFSGLLLLFCSI